MKKLLLALMIGLFSVPALAQFQQGRMLVGGALGLSFDKRLYKDNGNTTERYRSTSLSLDPNFGYFIVDRFAIGAGLSFSTTRTRRPNDEVSTQEQFTFSPLLRYYLPSRVFFQLRVPFGNLITTTETGSDLRRNYYGVTGLSLGVGYAIMLNSNVALEPMIQYSSTGYRERDSRDREVQNGLNLRMGFQVYLGR